MRCAALRRDGAGGLPRGSPDLVGYDEAKSRPSVSDEGGDVASRRRATSFLEDARKKKAPLQPAPPAGAPRRGRRESLGGRRGSLSGRHNSINTVAEFYDLGRLQAGDFFGDCSSFAVGGAKPSMWNEGPDYSVTALCFTRIYCAPCSLLVKNANPAIRACFSEIRAHLERVSTAYVCRSLFFSSPSLGSMLFGLIF